MTAGSLVYCGAKEINKTATNTSIAGFHTNFPLHFSITETKKTKVYEKRYLTIFFPDISYRNSFLPWAARPAKAINAKQDSPPDKLMHSPKQEQIMVSSAWNLLEQKFGKKMIKI